MSFMARLVAGAKFALTGKGDWFGPREPLAPVAEGTNAEGRQFDFPVGLNLNVNPRTGEAVSFDQMRTLADAYDLLRLVIETRKDQMCKLKWTVRPKDTKKQADARCEEVMRFLEYPDLEHDWNTWFRALLEDLFVIDAPVIYPRRKKGGGLYSLDLIDGSTIKRVIDGTGRTPMEGPAYQQVLKGVPAVNYTRDELIYRPRNFRTHKVYGFSPVEQVVMTVNVALRRQVHQLQYFTEGNVPDALIGVPSNWTTSQIKDFQNYWDELLEGNTGKRRKAKFVPGDMKYQPTREPTIKDQYDEWLARIVCYAFSVSPQPFMAMMNRATAETAQEAALEEGLAPIMLWAKSVMDYIVAKVFGYDDLEFHWDDEVQLDKLQQAQVHSIYVNAKVITPDEVREDLGKQAMTQEQREAAWPTPEIEPPGGGGGPPKKGEEEEGTGKADYLGDVLKRGKPRPKADGPAPINRDRRAVKRVTKAIAAATEAALAGCAEEAVNMVELIRKGDNDLIKAIEQMKLMSLDVLVGDIQPEIEAMAKDGANVALFQIGIGEVSVNQVHEMAVAWAKDHAAELVGKKWVDGELVDNPNAKWRIDTRTREAIKTLVTQANEEGWSNAKLAKALREDEAFGKERALMIARTEAAKADVEGNMTAYRAAGVAKKRWLIAQGDYCQACEDNAAVGVIPFDDAFPSGELAPPAHPNCRCDVLPVTGSEGEK